MNKNDIPNLLIIMSDEHQSGVMGCAAHPFIKTPNLDKLAARGTRFSNAYTPSSICVPARASFATGLYPHQTRLWDNAMPYTGSIRGWGHALQDKGIRVESIGKLHYRAEEDPAGFDKEHIPMMVVDGVGMVWASIRKEHERKVMGDRSQRMLGEYIGPGTSNYTDYDTAVTERTQQWIADNADSTEPWCLYVGLVAPHFPLVVPQEFYDLYPLDSLPESKLHPDDGFPRHPWVQKQYELDRSEEKFENAEERLSAMAAYYGLCSWMDHNIGQIVDSLEQAGTLGNTRIIYTADHGDNIGARGLWGKSNMYQEAVKVPMIDAGPATTASVCDTPVSLLDISATISKHFASEFTGNDDLLPLEDIAANDYDPERVVFSEYHAAGAVSGAFMIRKGHWKLIHYIGFEDELFDLESDPEEIDNVAAEPQNAEVMSMLMVELYAICDPEKTDQLAFADQAALIEKHGGLEAAMNLGAPAATPPPKI